MEDSRQALPSSHSSGATCKSSSPYFGLLDSNPVTKTYNIVASKNKHLDSSTIQSSGQTDRALKPFQTAQERVICADAASSRKRPVWLRTCYTVAQQRDYDDLVSRADAFSGQGYSIGEELNDASRYDVKSEWSSVLLQIPSIIDAEQDDKKQKETNDKLVPGSEPGTLEEASAQNSTLIYLVDQEALDEGLVKIKWLGQYGQCIWENKIVPELLMGFREALEKGASLAELVGDMTENGATISR